MVEDILQKETAYLSFDSALSYYGIIDQCIFDLKLASLYNSFTRTTPLGKIKGIVIPEDFFFGFEEKELAERKINIALPEKALLDHIWYCEDTGKIFNPEDIDWEALDTKLLDAYSDSMGINYKKYIPQFASAHPKESYRLEKCREQLLRTGKK